METSSTGDIISSPAREEPSSSPLADEDISSVADQSERSSEYSSAGSDEESTDDDKTLIMETEKQPESQTISYSYPPPGQSTASWADLVKQSDDGEGDEEEEYF